MKRLDIIRRFAAWMVVLAVVLRSALSTYECGFVPKGCRCTFSRSRFYISCEEFHEWDDLISILKTNFVNKTLHRLFMDRCNVTKIEEGTFSGLILEHFEITKSAIGSIDNRAFDGVQALNTLTWTFTTNVETIPNAVIETNLTALRFNNMDLKTVETQLQNLTMLNELDLSDNQITYIDPDALKRCFDLQTVDFSKNKIESLDSSLFENLHKLRIFSMTNNLLMSVAENLLPSSKSLEIVHLQGNLFSNMSDIIDYQVPNLSTLYLDNNPLTVLAPYHFDGKFGSLRTLRLTNASIWKIEKNTFNSLTSLRILYLSRNNLTHLPEALFAYTKQLTELRLDNNNLADISQVFRNATSLTKLFLSSNKISVLTDAFNTLPRLKSLFLEENLIERIPCNSFTKLPQLEVLHLFKNRISKLCYTSFNGLEQSLHVLDLGKNALEDLGTAFSNEKSLRKLQHLHIDHNMLTSLTHADFHLESLIELYLNNNSLSTLDRAFLHLRNLKKLHLSGNNLKTLQRENFRTVNNIRDIRLQDNPLSCDCRIVWLIDWSKSGSEVIFEDAPCQSPEWLEGQRARDLAGWELEHWKDCPQECNTCFCTSNGDSISISVSCEGRNLTDIPRGLPTQTSVLNMSSNQLTKIPRNLSRLAPDLTSLDLSNNRIESLDNVQLPVGLKELDISGNQLTRFPFGFQYHMNLTEARISRNPWLCDCDTEPFRNWLLKNYRAIHDVNSTNCSDASARDNLRGRVIATLVELDLCPLQASTYLLIALGVLAFLLSVSGGFIGYIRYQMPIKVWLYTKGLCLRWVKEEDLDEDKDFDAFLVFSTEELDYAKQILNELEGKHPHFRLCVHYRDFIGGELIQDNIARAVKASKKTLVLLSNTFLDSQWAMEEFREAHRQTMEEKLNRIILVLVGQLPPTVDIPADMKAYLKSVTYLQWEDKYFWQKLFYAMPKHPVPKERRKGMTESVL